MKRLTKILIIACLAFALGKSQRQSNPERFVWHKARFSDLIANIVANAREGCQLGKELGKKLLRTRVLRSRRLQKLVKRQARIGNLTVLDKIIKSSRVDLSLKENLHIDYQTLKKYSQLFMTVRKHSRLARQVMRHLKNKLRNVGVQLRQAMDYQGERPVKVQGFPDDVQQALGRRRDMDDVELAINDYAIIREIGEYLNKMGVLYAMYNEYVEKLASSKSEC